MPLIAGFGMLIHTKSRRTIVVLDCKVLNNEDLMKYGVGGMNTLYRWQPKQKVSIAKNGCLIIGCKNIRITFPILSRADSSMTVVKRLPTCAKKYARGLP